MTVGKKITFLTDTLHIASKGMIVSLLLPRRQYIDLENSRKYIKCQEYDVKITKMLMEKIVLHEAF